MNTGRGNGELLDLQYTSRNGDLTMLNETTHRPTMKLSGADTAELRAILALPHIAAMTPAQRVEHAQGKLSDATANYRGWAMNPTNERVLCLSRQCVETLENAVVLLQIAAFYHIENIEPDPPTQTPTAEPIPDETPDRNEKYNLGRARRYCFSAIKEAGLPSDTSLIRAHYSDYFGEYAGDTTTKWTAEQWQKMANAVAGQVWKRAGTGWVKVFPVRRAA